MAEYPLRVFCAEGRDPSECHRSPYPAVEGENGCKSFECERCAQRVGWCRGHVGDRECGLCDDCCVELGMPCIDEEESEEELSERARLDAESEMPDDG